MENNQCWHLYVSVQRVSVINFHLSYLNIATQRDHDYHDVGTYIPQTCYALYTMTVIKKESLIYLTTPLEHIDFHVTGYWISSIWSL